MKSRMRRCIVALGVSAALGTAGAVLIEAPAHAAWPSTIKICNNTESTDTNGGATDGKNIDIDRPAGGGFDLYSNELLPGDCTGNVGNPSAVRIDLTDDGANFSPDGSSMIGIDADGIDDSQGPWDMACVDSVTASNENAVPISQTTAEHVPAGGAIKVRVRAARNCGANLSDHARVCNPTTSVASFDLFKTDGSYNNELAPNECSNWKDVDGDNPLKIDVSDDGANTASGAKIEWTWVIKDAAPSNEPGCNRVSSSSAVDQLSEIEIPAFGEDAGASGIDVRLYSDGTAANTLCGVAVTTGTAAPQADLPSCAAPQSTIEPEVGGTPNEAECDIPEPTVSTGVDEP